MASEVITKFKLETTQFDSKLRDSAKNVSELTHQLTLAGKDFDRFASKNVDAAKALGQIAPSANNAKDKVKELVGAYNDAVKAYNQLTEEQKKTDYGKALAESIGQLKGKVSEAKKELYDLGDSSKKASGGLESLTSALGMNVKSLVGFGTALSVAKAALDVAKDAFFKSEDNIDEWGRTVEGAKGAYDYFLDALNTGNWSNFFDNLETAINGSRDLYDALDRLGSVKANNQAAIALVQAEIQQLRLLKSQGKDVDEQIKSATKRLRDLQMGSVNAGKDAGRSSMQNVLRNSINAMGGGVSDVNINNAVNKILKEGQAAFDHFRKVAENFEKYSGAQSVRDVMAYSSTGLAYKVGEEKYFDINKLTPAQQRAYRIAKAVTMQETPLQQGIGIYAQAASEETAANREEFRGNRYALQRPGGGGGKNGGKPEVWSAIDMSGYNLDMVSLDRSRSHVQGMLSDATAAYNNAGDEMGRAAAQVIIDRLKEELGMIDSEGKSFEDAYSHDFNKDIEANKKQQARDEKERKQEVMTFQDMSAGVNQMVGGISQMTESLEQMGIDLPDGFTAVLSGLQTIASLLSAIQTISTIQTFFGKAGGGVIGKAASGFVVPGNSYSGDRLRLPVAGGGMIGVNSGEVVLNRAQAGVIEQELNGGGNGGPTLQPYVDGEKIWLGVNNYLRRSGRGEIVTGK